VSSPSPFGHLADAARERGQAGLRRRLRPRSATDGLLDLASNDYLGLARDARVVAGAVEAAVTWGAGSTGSRLVTGSTELHAELEAALAELLGAPAALVFSSGYLANLGVVTALSGPGSLVVSDAQNHASLVDACRLSRARVVVVPHADADAVAKALAERTEPRAVVVTDAVFSVDGDAAPIADLAAVATDGGAALVVDEAHAVGVVGPGGAGVVSGAGLADHPAIVRTVTLSKALGAQGGAVAGPAAVVEHLVQTARPFVYDTALAPASAGAALAALGVLAAEPDRPGRATGAARRLRAAALAAGFVDVPEPAAAVVGVPVGPAAAAVAAADAALAAGVRVGCFRPPSVPDGVSRLRLAGRAVLDDADLRRAEQALLAAASAPTG
jgi:8-amino-7-oxononanoate synthase